MIKFFYNNKIGRALRPILSTRWASRFMGWAADQTFSRFFIKSFIKKNKINMNEFIVPEGGYQTFNEFFYRKLKQGTRSINTDASTVISPADCCLYSFQELSKNSTFFVKDCKFDLENFLKNKALATDYQNGSLLLFRLAPQDYHRFHFSFDCTPSSIKVISGTFESVNPVVYKSGIQPLSENERHLIRINSPTFGQVLFVPVGAMFVGKIHETFQSGKEYKKGDEMGYFAFGASSLVMIFKQNSIKINDDIVQNSQNNIETQVKMGVSVAIKL